MSEVEVMKRYYLVRLLAIVPAHATAYYLKAAADLTPQLNDECFAFRPTELAQHRGMNAIYAMCGWLDDLESALEVAKQAASQWAGIPFEVVTEWPADLSHWLATPCSGLFGYSDADIHISPRGAANGYQAAAAVGTDGGAS